MFNKQPPNQRLTAEDIEVRIWGFVVVAVTLILFVIVLSLLYSVTFVTQPIKSMAPIDQAYTKMLNDIVLLIVGGIGGVMSKRAVGALAQSMAGSESPKPPAPTVSGPSPAPTSPIPDWNWMGYKNPELDEKWVPPPPPSTPADYIDPAVEDIAHERAAARNME
jgi:hypothetical protein